MACSVIASSLAPAQVARAITLCAVTSSASPPSPSSPSSPSSSAQSNDTRCFSCHATGHGSRHTARRGSRNCHVAAFRAPEVRRRLSDDERDFGGLELGLPSGSGLGSSGAASAVLAFRARGGALCGRAVLCLLSTAAEGGEGMAAAMEKEDVRDSRQGTISGGGEEEEEGGGGSPLGAVMVGDVVQEGGGPAGPSQDSIAAAAAARSGWASANYFGLGLAATAFFSQALSLWWVAPAIAAHGRLNLPDEIPEITPEEWRAFTLVYGGFAVFYLLLAPPAILHWMRIRAKEKKLLETFLMYYCVFVFFPGLMLWAPFTNFRPLPRDPSKLPKFDD